VAENRFLQSFCAVAASSVLVCGTLLLLTSTAPWTPPNIVSEPSTPDAPTVFAATEPALDAGRDAVAPETPAALHVEDTARSYTASIQRLPDAEERDEPATGHERIVARDSPLSVETADAMPDVAAQDAALPEPLAPVAPETIAAAADQIADLLSTLPPRVLAGDQSAAATKEVVEELAALPPPPPPVNAAEKTAPARDEVATMLAALPAPPMITVAAELAPAAKPESVQGGVKIARLNTNALMLASFAPQTRAEAKTVLEVPEAPEPVSVTASAATPPSLPQPLETAVAVEMPAPEALAADEQPATKLAALSAESVTDAAPPPPLPRRKPAEIVAANADEAAAPAEAEPQAKTSVASAAAQDKQTVQAPKQQVAQGGGLFGLFKPGTFTKPMTLAPADQPVAAPKASVTRSRGAYASQVWSRLARAKPRAGARGSASVSFAIAANGSLGAVRIARSSGNSRIDQLALQTVRNAAPFPAPPSGAASYTIRIDF